MSAFPSALFANTMFPPSATGGMTTPGSPVGKLAPRWSVGMSVASIGNVGEPPNSLRAPMRTTPANTRTATPPTITRVFEPDARRPPAAAPGADHPATAPGAAGGGEDVTAGAVAVALPRTTTAAGGAGSAAAGATGGGIVGGGATVGGTAA